MGDNEGVNRRISELLNLLTGGADGEAGVRAAALNGVKLIRADQSHPRQPMLYEPSIVIVGQGRKRAYVGG
jgi:hypothetical protein